VAGSEIFVIFDGGKIVAFTVFGVFVSVNELEYSTPFSLFCHLSLALFLFLSFLFLAFTSIPSSFPSNALMSPLQNVKQRFFCHVVTLFGILFELTPQPFGAPVQTQ
jgi:hypothetical protein